jgi:hypothetical protein
VEGGMDWPPWFFALGLMVLWHAGCDGWHVKPGDNARSSLGHGTTEPDRECSDYREGEPQF